MAVISTAIMLMQSRTETTQMVRQRLPQPPRRDKTRNVGIHDGVYAIRGIVDNPLSGLHVDCHGYVAYCACFEKRAVLGVPCLVVAS